MEIDHEPHRTTTKELALFPAPVLRLRNVEKYLPGKGFRFSSLETHFTSIVIQVNSYV